ncbi:hypothetical protein F5880DRAFT_682517 [Lentinula raphanica]|nr:hypothetical protein F5880DRAFT_682517 [Lentinula raphanica]
MGGSAFHDLPPNSCPRIPNVVYQALKARLTPVLEQIYVYVAVPPEAPEKLDHGDLDFAVYKPREDSFSNVSTPGMVNAPHFIVQAALGASHCILEDHNRTSNFAIAIEQGAWEELGCAEQEEKSRRAAGGHDIYYQVDVHVCADKNEWERVIYFHAYGDLGMIQGLIASNAGLLLGLNGLKYSHPPHPTVTLSQDFTQIAAFFGWSNERRSLGFNTRQEIFEWVCESRLFNPERFRTKGEGFTKVKAQRKMYYDFLAWVQEKKLNRTQSEVIAAGTEKAEEWQKRIREEALAKFDGEDKVKSSVLKNYGNKKRQKQIFNGTMVGAWIGANPGERRVKIIMDMVRERHGGADGIERIFEAEGEDGLKQRVLCALEEYTSTTQ